MVEKKTHIRPVLWSKPIRDSEGWDKLPLISCHVANNMPTVSLLHYPYAIFISLKKNKIYIYIIVNINGIIFFYLPN